MEKIVSRRINQFTLAQERIGATFVPADGVHIRLWAPFIKSVDVEWVGKSPSPLKKEDDGYFTGYFPLAQVGDRYYFLTDGQRIPDPASRYQPEGIFGPSEVVAIDHDWNDYDWKGLPFQEWVIYEIHTGAFSDTNNFSGIIADLPRLKDLGITTLEIMPVSQFSGDRNWGYDGVFPHAVQNSYGGPHGLKMLVDAAHRQGLAVILDVVYNHVGPEGNVLFGCAPYTQSKYKTPWGDALNFDGNYSDEVRRYFLQTVWQWLTEYHFDGLRLDAVQTIIDTSPITFLEEISLLKQKAENYAGRNLVLIAESDLNDSRLLATIDKNGIGFDAHWADDLHHAIHATLTGEKKGYYQDYGGAAQIAQIYKNGVAYEWDFSPCRKRYCGSSYEGIDKKRLIVQTQNHDQIGNRLLGERLSALVDFEKLKLAAACVFLSPSLPLLFMGEELASEKPFPYFISHFDENLLEAVRSGRKKEWESFNWKEIPPDPAHSDTFAQANLGHKDLAKGSKAIVMHSFYKTLISLSKQVRTMELNVDYNNEHKRIILHYQNTEQQILAILSFNEKETDYIIPRDENWKSVVISKDYQPGREISQPELISSSITIPPFSSTVLKSA